MKKRMGLIGVALVFMTACVWIASARGIDPPMIHIIGAYISVLTVGIVTIRFPISFFLYALCFDILAAGFGTVLNLYRTIDSYDKIVHFMSGILLAEAGRLLVTYLFKRNGVKSLISIELFFSVAFSFAGAGVWEIYEFMVDTFMGTNMQGGNNNTMGDIVSGVLGSLLFVLVYGLSWKTGKKS